MIQGLCGTDGFMGPPPRGACYVRHVRRREAGNRAPIQCHRGTHTNFGINTGCPSARGRRHGEGLKEAGTCGGEPTPLTLVRFCTSADFGTCAKLHMRRWP